MSEIAKKYYHKFIFESKDVDSLVALLNELPFNGFEIIDHQTIHGFVNSKDRNDLFEASLQKINALIPFSYEVEKIEMRNWNAEWEKDFEPVIVDDFCAVRADFHASIENVHYEIIVTPQMSFGTGHHETTRAMITMMQKIDFANKKVLDFGCGTGVLAILASKMGANDILGVDIDDNAYINSVYNCSQNNVNNVKVLQGDLSITDEAYDIILANINRHVILDTLPSLSKKLSAGSALLLSGILYSDISLIEKALMNSTFKIVDSLQIMDWMCILTEKV